MIDSISGRLVSKFPTYTVVEVAGVSFGVNIPLSTYTKLPDILSEVKLFTHFIIKEQTPLLYGFYTLQEKELFLSLIRVQGIGPRMGLAILSNITVEEFKKTINNGKTYALESIPGIGKKIAQRLVLELKDKFTKEKTEITTSPHNRIMEDACMALISLGYKKKEADLAVRKAKDALIKPHSVEELIKQALKFL